MKILNVGVVGCGGIANNKHLPAMKKGRRAGRRIRSLLFPLNVPDQNKV